MAWFKGCERRRPNRPHEHLTLVSALLVMVGLLAAGCRDEAPGIGQDGGVPGGDAEVITGPPQWAMVGANPRRNHRSAYVGPRQGQHTVVDLSWLIDTPRADVLVDAVGPQGTLYLNLRLGNGDGWLVSLQPDGTINWTIPPDWWKVLGSVALDTEGHLFFEGRKVMDDSDPMNPLFYIFFNTDTTKQLTWLWGPEELLGMPVEGHRSAPVWDDDGNVYVVLTLQGPGPETESWLYSFDPNGQIRWRWERAIGGTILSLPPVLGADDSLYVHARTDPEGVYALSLDGQERWFIPDPFHDLWSMAAGDDGTLYVLVVLDEPELHAVDPAGNVLWTIALPPADTIPVGPPGRGIAIAIAADGTLYVAVEVSDAFSDPDLLDVGRIYAVAPDGFEKWSYDPEGLILGELAVDAEGVLYTVLVTPQTTRVLGLRPDGTKLLDVDLGPDFDTSFWFEHRLPVVIAEGNRLYVGEYFTGLLHIISP